MLQKLPGLCPDQYVLQIFKLKGQPQNPESVFPKSKRIDIFEQDTLDLTDVFGNILTSPKVKSPFMIFILESPHKKEFDKNGKPIGPAMGNTGINIREHIRENFRKHIKHFQNYHLILMNAIPFQCSLGVEPPGSIRDAVFDAAWEDEKVGKSFFEDRLDSLLKALQKKTVVIVNACTASKSRKSNVTKAILKKLNKWVKEVWEVPHPSSPHWCKGKNFKKIYTSKS